MKMLKSFILICVLLLFHQSLSSEATLRGSTNTWNRELTAVAQAPSNKNPCGSTVPDLAIMILDMALTDSAHTLSKVKLMLNDRTRWSPVDLESLESCLDLHTCAFSSLKQAAKNFKASQYNEVNNWATGAIGCTQLCEDGFKGRTSPLTTDNNQVVQLSRAILDMSAVFA